MSSRISIRMEQLPLLASSSKAAITIPFHLSLEHTDSTSTSPPEAAPAPPYLVLDSSGHSNHDRGSETIKAKIISHPLYPALLRAFIDCRKVGAPPEVVGRLSSLADELESNTDDMQEQRTDRELDQFMEIYCDMLMRYKRELTRPIQEVDEFFGSMEAQIDLLALDATSCERGGSSEDEQLTGDVAGLPAITSPSDEDRELKNQILNKYSGYVSNLWRELSKKKKKKDKLPRDALEKLFHWWQLHYRWPYPSELEKAALAESTGLDAKQINNWFINQRKRHWKPPAMDHRLQPTYGAPSSYYAALRTEGQYFTGVSAYPRCGP